jgi:hypothetical protein
MNKHETEYFKGTMQLISVASDAVYFWGIFSKFLPLSFSNDGLKFFEFNQSVRIASLSAFTLELNKLIDKSGFSIFKIRNYLRSHPCLFGKSKEFTNNIIIEVDNKLSSHEIIITNLRENRNRYQVHIDKNDFIESPYKVFKESPINLPDLESLLTNLCECLGMFISVYRKNQKDPFFDELEEKIIRGYLIDKQNVYDQIKIDEVISRLRF